MHFLQPFEEFTRSTRFIRSKRERSLIDQHYRVLGRVKLDLRFLDLHVRNDHILVRVLKHIAIATDDDFRAYNYARDNAPSIAGMLGMFGGTSDGRFTEKPYFFEDENSPEAVIYVDREDSHKLVIDNIMHESEHRWTYWSPIRVVSHGYTDMDYACMSVSHNEGKRITDDPNNINVIEVDLPLLYMQYRYWLKSDQGYYADGTKKSLNHFMTVYPLANAIESQMEIAYFNRMMRFFLEEPILTNRKLNKYHTAISTYQHVDESIIEILKNLKKHGGLNYSRLVNNLPALTHTPSGLLFQVNDLMKQTRTLPILIYLTGNIYRLWLKFTKERQQQRWNTDELANIRKGWKMLNNANYFKVMNDKRANRIYLKIQELQSYL